MPIRSNGMEGALAFEILPCCNRLLLCPLPALAGNIFTAIFLRWQRHISFIVQNHPFVDGNKRVGVASALVFLELNGVDMKATNDALVQMVLAVVEHKIGKAGIAEFFRGHAMKSKK